MGNLLIIFKLLTKHFKDKDKSRTVKQSKSITRFTGLCKLVERNLQPGEKLRFNLLGPYKIGHWCMLSKRTEGPILCHVTYLSWLVQSAILRKDRVLSTLLNTSVLHPQVKTNPRLKVQCFENKIAFVLKMFPLVLVISM